MRFELLSQPLLFASSFYSRWNASESADEPLQRFLVGTMFHNSHYTSDNPYMVLEFHECNKHTVHLFGALVTGGENVLREKNNIK